MASQVAEQSDAIGQLLERLRRRIRAYVWIEGLALTVAVAAGWFWTSLALDWMFEPPAPLRIGMLVILGLALAHVVYHYVLRRAFVRLGDSSLALLIERHYPSLRYGLLTTVELDASPAHAAPFSAQMLAHTRRQAAAASRELPVEAVLNRRPLAVAAGVAAALLVGMAIFAVAASAAFGVWARRNLELSPELWPRKTHLRVVGFESGHMKVAKGTDFDLVVQAETGKERVVPETVDVRYGASDGVWARDRMTRVGEASASGDPFQSYAYQFKSLLAPREFWVSGGDDRQGPFTIDVVDSPTLVRTTLHCEYPPYMQRAPRDTPAAGLAQIPIGSVVTLVAEANKPLVSAQIDVLSGSRSPVGHKLNLVSETGTAQKKFSLPLGVIDGDQTLLCSLLDSDGIRGRDPVRVAIGAVPDEPPQLNVQLEGIGAAITPAAMLPTVGEIVDDYGVARAWFEFHVDDAAPSQQPLAATTAGRSKVPVREALEVGPLHLVPKQKFHFAIAAADTYALSGAPNVASSQRYTLDVVTPEQLRGMLEARELMLRRRFETIIGEFTETRDLLARLRVGPAATKPPVEAPAGKQPAKAAENKKTSASGVAEGSFLQANSDKAGAKNDRAEQGAAAGPHPAKDGTAESKTKRDDARAPAKPPAGDEPEDSIRRPEEKTPEQLLALARLHAERVLQNSQRSAQETLEVADAFDGICTELINNRVDTEELKSRLKGGISDPLRSLVAGRFLELDKSLRAMQSRLEEPAAAPRQQDALRRMDQILADMRQALDRMLELETFNEALDMLRAVISAQEKVNEQTKAEQKKKLRELIEE